MSRPEHKEYRCCGGEDSVMCSVCNRIYGYNEAIDECRAYYESDEYVKSLIDVNDLTEKLFRAQEIFGLKLGTETMWKIAKAIAKSKEVLRVRGEA